ncbi:MAG TPA: DUF4168 domain-containing protein [Candidatus Binataceae bacterium]
MFFKPCAIAVAVAALAMTITLPSSAMVVASRSSARSAAALYAQAEATNPRPVDDAMLKRTAAAYVKVRYIAERAQQEISSTDDTARKEQLAAESESAKVEAVKQEGMDPQEYDAVLQLVKTDSTLQHKFLSYVQGLRHAS